MTLKCTYRKSAPFYDGTPTTIQDFLIEGSGWEATFGVFYDPEDQEALVLRGTSQENVTVDFTSTSFHLFPWMCRAHQATAHMAGGTLNPVSMATQTRTVTSDSQFNNAEVGGMLHIRVNTDSGGNQVELMFTILDVVSPTEVTVDSELPAYALPFTGQATLVKKSCIMLNTEVIENMTINADDGRFRMGYDIGSTYMATCYMRYSDVNWAGTYDLFYQDSGLPCLAERVTFGDVDLSGSESSRWPTGPIARECTFTSQYNDNLGSSGNGPMMFERCVFEEDFEPSGTGLNEMTIFKDCHFHGRFYPTDYYYGSGSKPTVINLKFDGLRPLAMRRPPLTQDVPGGATLYVENGMIVGFTL